MLKLKPLFKIPFRGKHVWFADQTKRMNRMIGKLLGEQNKKIRSILHAADVDVSRGAPRFLIETKGHTKTIKRRQAMLNKNFMESLTDVIANNPIGLKLRELKVEITQVEVSQDYEILSVYWISDNPNLSEVDRELRMIKGSLHKLMIEQRFMNRIPVIQFVFDDQSSGLQHLNEIYQKLDYGKDFEPTKETDVKTFSEILTGPKDLIPSDASGSEVQSPSDLPKFWYPPDMKLNVLGLDYEALMNKVLFNMRKSRAAHLNYNPASKPSLPAEWVAPPIYNAPPEPHDASGETPDERIQIMRNFLTENRKKRQKLHHAVRKRELDHDNLIYQNAELAKAKCDEDTFIEEYEYDEEVEEEEDKLMDWEEERKVDEEVDHENKPSSS